MPQYHTPRLTVTQREELLAQVVRAAGGRVTLTAEGKKTQFTLPGKSPHAFTGKENPVAIAEKLHIDLMELEPKLTKFDGIGLIQARERFAQSLQTALQNTSKNQLGLVGLENSISQAVRNEGLAWSIVGDPDEAWQFILNTIDVRESLEKQQELPYDKGRQQDVIHSILRALDVMGVTVFDPALTPRLQHHVNDEMRQSPDNPYRLTEMSAVHDAIRKTILKSAVDRAGSKRMLTQIHGMMYTRNIALGTTKNPVSTPEFLSPYTGKNLLRAYQYALRGQQDKVSEEIAGLTGTEHPLDRSHRARGAIESIAEHAHRRHQFLQTIFAARMEFSDIPDIEKHQYEYSIASLKERLMTSESSPQSVANDLILLSSFERWVKPSLFEGDEDSRRRLTERAKEYMNQRDDIVERQSKWQVQHARLQESAKKIYTHTTSKINQTENDLPRQAKELNELLNANIPEGKLPRGKGVKTLDEKISALSDALVGVFNDPSNKILEKNKAEALPLIAARAEKDSGWLSVYNQINDDASLNGNFSQRLNTAIERYVSTKLAEQLVLESVRQPEPEKPSTTEQPDKEPQKPKGVSVGAAKRTPEESPSSSGEIKPETGPENEPEIATGSIEKNDERQPANVEEKDGEPSLPVITPNGNADASLNSRKLRNELDALQEHLIDLCFDKEGELTEFEELEWLNQRWEAIVGDVQELKEDALPSAYQRAFSAFDPLSSSKSKKTLKNWYLKSVERSLLVERLGQSNTKISAVFNKLSSDDQLSFRNALGIVKASVSDASGNIPEHVDIKTLERFAQSMESLYDGIGQSPKQLSSFIADFKSDNEAFLKLQKIWSSVAKENPDSKDGMAIHWDKAVDTSRWLDPEQRKKQLEALGEILTPKSQEMILSFKAETSLDNPWDKEFSEGMVEPLIEIPSVAEESQEPRPDAPETDNLQLRRKVG